MAFPSLYCSGVARPLPLAGRVRAQRESVGVRGLARGKIFGATPFRRSENEGNALFSHILHHKHDYIEGKFRQDVLINFHQEIILIIASYSKKAKEEFSFSYKRSNISSTKYEMNLLTALLQYDLVLVVES